jgi:hypothetical protein
MERPFAGGGGRRALAGADSCIMGGTGIHCKEKGLKELRASLETTNSKSNHESTKDENTKRTNDFVFSSFVLS